MTEPTTRLTVDELAAIQARLIDAMAVPWQIECIDSCAVVDCDGALVADAWTTDEAAFIASSPTDIAALLREVEALTRERDEFRKRIDEITALTLLTASIGYPHDVAKHLVVPIGHLLLDALHPGKEE